MASEDDAGVSAFGGPIAEVINGYEYEFEGEGEDMYQNAALDIEKGNDTIQQRLHSGASGDAEEDEEEEEHLEEEEGEEQVEEEEQEKDADVEVEVRESAVVRPRIPARPGVCARFAVPSFSSELDVFLMVRRKKTTVFIDAKEDTTVLELKRMISGITKVLPEDQKLFFNNNELDDKKKMSDYGLNSGTAKPQIPATIALVFKDDNGEWEGIDMAPLSQPPELPEVMRQQEPTGVADAA